MNNDIVENITKYIYVPIKIIEWFNIDYIDMEKIIMNTSCTPEFIEKNKTLLNYSCWKKLCIMSKYKPFINKYYNVFNNELVLLSLKNNENLELISDLNKSIKKNKIDDFENIINNSVNNMSEEALYQKLLNLCRSSSKYLDIVENHICKLDSSCWYFIYKNPYAIDFIKKHTNIYDIKDHNILFPLVQNPNAIDIIKNNLHNLNSKLWQYLCINENAIDIIIDNIDKITIDGFHNLALNDNPRVIDIIKDKLDLLYYNVKFWKLLSGNPNIFVLDEQQFKKNIDVNMKNIFNKIDYSELYKKKNNY